MGRRTRGATPRTARLQVAMTPGELTDIVEAAEAAGMTVPELVRGHLARVVRWTRSGRTISELDQEDIELAPVEDPERATERRILAALRERPQPSDGEIAERLDCTVHVVTRVRRDAGIPGVERPMPRSGWQETIRQLHAQGLTNRQIAEETGWALRTVQQRVYQCGLRANRRK